MEADLLLSESPSAVDLVQCPRYWICVCPAVVLGHWRESAFSLDRRVSPTSQKDPPWSICALHFPGASRKVVQKE